LFSESHSRAVLTCAPERASAVIALAQELGVPVARVGTVGPRGGALRLKLRDASVDISVERLREVYFGSIPRRMGD
jgi:phosphoribosylformylglycinamidine synthase